MKRLIIITIIALGLWANSDSQLNLPVISSLVCSLKGGSFQDPIGLPPACYKKSE